MGMLCAIDRGRPVSGAGGRRGLAPTKPCEASRAVLLVDGTPSALRLSRCSTMRDEPCGSHVPGVGRY
eukprot:2163125-Prymnesium_polylepis.3